MILQANLQVRLNMSNNNLVKNKWLYLLNDNNKIKYIIFILLLVCYIIIIVLTKPSYDYVSMLSAANKICKGIPLYQQDMNYHYFDGFKAGYPKQLPLFIYFLALLTCIFGNNLIIGRMALMIFALLNSILIEKIYIHELEKKDIEKSWYDNYLSMTYFMNPQVIYYSAKGQFDNFAIFFLLLSIFLFLQIIKQNSLQKKILFSFFIAISISLGFNTKLAPIIFLPIINITLKEYQENIQNYVITNFTIIFSFIPLIFLFISYPNFGTVILFQSKRLSYGLSFFILCIDMDHCNTISNVSLITSFVILYYLYYLEITKDKKFSFTLYSGLILLVYLCLSKGFYPHYILWFIPFFTFSIFLFLKSHQYKHVIIICFSFFVHITIFLYWGLNYMNIELEIGMLLSILHTLILIIYILYTVKALSLFKTFST